MRIATNAARWMISQRKPPAVSRGGPRFRVHFFFERSHAEHTLDSILRIASRENMEHNLKSWNTRFEVMEKIVDDVAHVIDKECIDVQD